MKTRSFAISFNKTLMSIALGLSASASVSAAMSPSAILTMVDGVGICVDGGVYPSCPNNDFRVEGSYFAVDFDNDGMFSETEKSTLFQKNGLSLGIAQPASGSHQGRPDGTEMSSIDMPWVFFSNTGMHYSSAVNIISDDTMGNVELNFSGWGMTWNAIPGINLSGGSQDCGSASDGICVRPDGVDIAGIFNNGTGRAVVTCATDCSVGDTYTLDYYADVPQADVSNFGGVHYMLHLEGSIADSLVTKNVSVNIEGGAQHQCESGGANIIAVADIATADDFDVLSVQWMLDGHTVSTGANISIFAGLGTHTLAVTVETRESGILHRQKEFVVMDTVAPEITAAFINVRNGEELTQLDEIGYRMKMVEVSYEAVDSCDSNVQATATLGLDVSDGDRLGLTHARKVMKLFSESQTEIVKLTVNAKDSSGNGAVLSKVLQ